MFPRNRHGEDLAWERRSVGSLLQDVPSIVPLVTTTVSNIPFDSGEEPQSFTSLAAFCRLAKVYKKKTSAYG